MKKIIELENRWKAYKYKSIILYLFIIIFIIFVVLLGFFIKLQFDKKHARDNIMAAQTMPATPTTNLPPSVETNANTASSNDIAPTTSSNINAPTSEASSVNKINFICRQVIADKLTARSQASFKSSAIGYYPKDSIFCVQDNKGENGLVRTANGWVSANDKYSVIVDVNMFVDSGFYKYQQVATNKSKPKRTDFEEVKVFDKPQNVESPKATPKPPMQVVESSNVVTPPQAVRAPKQITISTEKMTDENMIDFKKADFRNTNDYDTAIDVARFYYKAKDYKNSIKWAVSASNADSKGKQKSESWIIYAKSLYLSGKQEQAIDVLTRYVSSTSSQDAIDALNNMKQGII